MLKQLLHPIYDFSFAEPETEETFLLKDALVPEPIPVEEPTLSIQSIMKEKGIEIQECNTEPIAPVQSLSQFLAEQYALSYPFIKFLRERYTKKSTECFFYLTSFPMDQIDAIIAVASKLASYGIISNYYVREKTVISGSLSYSTRVMNYLTGSFLEIYAASATEEVIREYASGEGIDYELIRNAKVVNGTGEIHEIDLLFRVGDKVFWSEVKSGSFSNFDKLREVGLFLGLNPDKHILLSAETSDEIADAAAWFFQYYIASIANYKEKLIDMIDHAIKGGKENG